jgi:tRNA(fMet)-specific endonuclease VapC
MLDTDSVSFALRGQGRVGDVILQHSPSHLCISAITLAELHYGAARRKSPKLDRLIETFVASITVMVFDDRCATVFGRMASELADAGSPIGDFDVLIAAHAVTLDLTLVTNNAKHFGRVRGLRTENWF